MGPKDKAQPDWLLDLESRIKQEEVRLQTRLGSYQPDVTDIPGGKRLRQADLALVPEALDQQVKYLYGGTDREIAPSVLAKMRERSSNTLVGAFYREPRLDPELAAKADAGRTLTMLTSPDVRIKRWEAAEGRPFPGAAAFVGRPLPLSIDVALRRLEREQAAIGSSYFGLAGSSQDPNYNFHETLRYQAAHWMSSGMGKTVQTGIQIMGSASMGAIPMGLIGAGIGAAVTGGPGLFPGYMIGTKIGGAAGAAWGTYQAIRTHWLGETEEFTQETTYTRMFDEILDKGVDAVEQGLGMISQMAYAYANPGVYGTPEEIYKNRAAALQASKAFFETTPTGWAAPGGIAIWGGFAARGKNKLLTVPALAFNYWREKGSFRPEPGSQKAKNLQEWEKYLEPLLSVAGLDLYDPDWQQMYWRKDQVWVPSEKTWVDTPGAGYQAFVDYDYPSRPGWVTGLADIRTRIINGEPPQTVMDEYFTGANAQMLDLAGKLSPLDPLDQWETVAPWFLSKTYQLSGKVGELTGIEHFKSDPIMDMALLEIDSGTIIDAWQTYRNLLLLHKPVSDAASLGTELSLVEKFAIGADIVDAAGGGDVGKRWYHKWPFKLAITMPGSKARETVITAADHINANLSTIELNPDDPTAWAHEAVAHLRNLVGANVREGHRGTDVENANNSVASLLVQRSVQNSVNAEGHGTLDQLYEGFVAHEQSHQVVRDMATTLERPVSAIRERLVMGEIEALVREYQEAGGVLPDNYTLEQLSTVADYYKEGGITGADEFRAAFMEDVLSGVASWGNVIFGVKQHGFMWAFTQALKSFESIVLLGLNPGYLMNNFWNGMATIVARGSWNMNTALMTTTQLKGVMAEYGPALPVRFAQGIGLAGDHTMGAEAGMDAAVSKAMQMILAEEIPSGTGLRGAVIRGFQGAESVARGIGGTVGIFSRAAARVEQYQSAWAMLSAFQEMWGQVHRVGVGIDPLPVELEASLGTRLYNQVIKAVLQTKDPAKLGKVIRGETLRINVERYFDRIDQAMGDEPGTAARLLAAGALGDIINKALADLPTDATGADIQQIFQNVRDQLNEGLDEQLRFQAEQAREHAVLTIEQEGVAGFMRLLNDIGMSEAATFDYYQAQLNMIWQRISAAGPAGRAELVRQMFADADRVWERFYRRERVFYEALAEALDVVSATEHREEFLAAVDSKRKAALDFHETKRRLMRAFFEKRGGDWVTEVREPTAVLYERYKRKRRLSMDAIDKYLVEAMAQATGNPEYAQAVGDMRARMRAFDARDVEQVTDFWNQQVKKERGELTQAEIDAMETFREFHDRRSQQRWAALQQEQNDLAAALELLKPGEPPAPEGPSPEGPEVPPEAPLTPDPDRTAVEDAGARDASAEDLAIGTDEHAAKIRRLASDYGIGSISSTGVPYDKHILNSVNEFVIAENPAAYHLFTEISDIPVQRMRDAMAWREGGKQAVLQGDLDIRERFRTQLSEHATQANYTEEEANVAFALLDHRAEVAVNKGEVADVARWWSDRFASYDPSVSTPTADRPDLGTRLALGAEAGPVVHQDRPGARAAIRILADGRAILITMRATGVTSLVHEISHVFRQDLRGEDLKIAFDFVFQESARINNAYVDNLPAVEKILGGRELRDRTVEEGEQIAEVTGLAYWEVGILSAGDEPRGPADGIGNRWNARMEEIFARNFETYIVTNRAPSEALAGIFEQLKQWLSEFYKKMRRSSLPPEVSPELVGVFDRLLAEYPDITGSFGDNTQALGPDKTTVHDLQWVVVDIHDLRASHDSATFVENPRYPQTLQPRDRTRAGSQAQYARLYNNPLFPTVVTTDQHALDDGSPIINAAGVVLSGNLRTMVLQGLLRDNPTAWANYQQLMQDVVNELGIPGTAGIENPVLVRMRISNANELQFVRDTNAPRGIDMSAGENAGADAAMMTPGMIQSLEIGENQSIEQALRSPRNRRFVETFMELLPAETQAGMVAEDGSLSQAGIRRMTAATFVYAYGTETGGRLARAIFESTDLKVKNIANGLLAASGDVARADGMVAEGYRMDGLQIGQDLAIAVTKLADIKAAGNTVERYLQQPNMFGAELTPFQMVIMADLNATTRSAKRVREIIKEYAVLVERQPDPRQASMFDKNKGVDATVLWEKAKQGPQTTLFHIEPGTTPTVNRKTGERILQQIGQSTADTVALLNENPEIVSASQRSVYDKVGSNVVTVYRVRWPKENQNTDTGEWSVFATDYTAHGDLRSASLSVAGTFEYLSKLPKLETGLFDTLYAPPTVRRAENAVIYRYDVPIDRIQADMEMLAPVAAAALGKRRKNITTDVGGKPVKRELADILRWARAEKEVIVDLAGIKPVQQIEFATERRAAESLITEIIGNPDVSPSRLFEIMGKEHNQWYDMDTTDPERPMGVIDETHPELTAWIEKVNRFIVPSEEGTVLFDLQMAADPWFSMVQRVADNSPTGRAPSQQWLSYFRKQPGVKGRELDAIGLTEFLAEDRILSREQVSNFIRKNTIEVSESVGRSTDTITTDQARDEWVDQVFSEYDIVHTNNMDPEIVTQHQLRDQVNAGNMAPTGEGSFWVPMHKDTGKFPLLEDSPLEIEYTRQWMEWGTKNSDQQVVRDTFLRAIEELAQRLGDREVRRQLVEKYGRDDVGDFEAQYESAELVLPGIYKEYFELVLQAPGHKGWGERPGTSVPQPYEINHFGGSGATENAFAHVRATVRDIPNYNMDLAREAVNEVAELYKEFTDGPKNQIGENLLIYRVRSRRSGRAGELFVRMEQAEQWMKDNLVEDPATLSPYPGHEVVTELIPLLNRDERGHTQLKRGMGLLFAKDLLERGVWDQNKFDMWMVHAGNKHRSELSELVGLGAKIEHRSQGWWVPTDVTTTLTKDLTGEPFRKEGDTRSVDMDYFIKPLLQSVADMSARETDPEPMFREMLLIEEIQSDWHQKLRRVRMEEVSRVAQERRISHKEAGALVPADFGVFPVREIGHTRRLPEMEVAKLFPEDAAHFDPAHPQYADQVAADLQVLEGTGDPFRPGDDVWVTFDQDNDPINWGTTTADSVEKSVYLLTQRLEEAGHVFDSPRIASKIRDQVPPAPYEGAWPGMSMRRMIQWAAQKGYDEIGWTTGNQQNVRNSLNRQVEAITSLQNPDGTWWVMIRPRRDRPNEQLTPLWEIQAQGRNYDMRRVHESDLRHILSRDVVDRIVNKEGRAIDTSIFTQDEIQNLLLRPEHDIEKDVRDYGQDMGEFLQDFEFGGLDYPSQNLGHDPTVDLLERVVRERKSIRDQAKTFGELTTKIFHRLDGEGLDVSGEGSRIFYDRILRNEVIKYAKKYTLADGSKVEVGTSNLKEFVREPVPLPGETLETQIIVGPEQARESRRPSTREDIVHSMPITEEMGGSTYLYHIEPGDRAALKREVLAKLEVSGKGNTTRMVAEILQEHAKDAIKRAGWKNGVISHLDTSTKSVEHIGRQFYDELVFSLSLGADSGAGWYWRDYPQALKVLGEVIPDLRRNDQVGIDANNLVTMFLAITSNQDQPQQQLKGVDALYQNFKTDGRLDGAVATPVAAVQQQLTLLQDLYEQFGSVDALKSHLLEAQTVAEQKQIAKAINFTYSPQFFVDTVVPMAVMYFGPKIGAFYANLSGEFHYLTMDRWMNRTHNRARGEIASVATAASLNTFRSLQPASRRDLQNLSDAQIIMMVGDSYQPLLAYKNRGGAGKNAFVTLLEKHVDKKATRTDDKHWRQFRRGEITRAELREVSSWWDAVFEVLRGRSQGQANRMIREHFLEKNANTIYNAEYVTNYDVPRSASQRDSMVKSMEHARQLLRDNGHGDFDIADLQAMLWYYEKQLYPHLGARFSGLGNYLEGAQTYVDAKAGKDPKKVRALSGRTRPISRRRGEVSQKGGEQKVHPDARGSETYLEHREIDLLDASSRAEEGGSDPIRFPDGRVAVILGRVPAGILVRFAGETQTSIIRPGERDFAFLPPGALDRITEGGPQPIGSAMEEMLYQRGFPMVEALERMVAQDVRQNQGPDFTVEGLEDSLHPDQMRQLNGWLREQQVNMANNKLFAVKWAEYKRDAALLNYSRRFHYNHYLGMVFPYEFWMTQTMMRWAMFSAHRPKWLAALYRVGKMMEESVIKPGVPSRIKGRLRIPLAFLPDWMKAPDSVYVNPLDVGLPLNRFGYPWEEYSNRANSRERQTVRVLETMVGSGDISQAEYSQALSSQQGPIWKRAEGLAIDKDKNLRFDGYDFALSVMGPHVPLQWAYQAVRGTPERIYPLPATRTTRTVSSLLGIGGPSGINLEGGIRRKLDLPIYDQWEEYRIDRALSDMVAEGVLTVDEATIAMIEQSGDVYTRAMTRAVKQSSWGTAASFIFGVSGQVYPEGERIQRENRTLFFAAMKAQDDGDTSALNQFFDNHPEYEVRLSLYKEPEERLRQFLVDKIWNQWMILPRLHRKDVEEALGPVWQETFLEKPETGDRDYASMPVETLALWAKTIGAYVPETEATRGVDALPVEYAPQEITTAYDDYIREREFYVGGKETDFWDRQKEYFDLRGVVVEDAEAIIFDQMLVDKFPDVSKLEEAYYMIPAVADRRSIVDLFFPNSGDLWKQYFSIPKESRVSLDDPVPTAIENDYNAYYAEQAKLFPEIGQLYNEFYDLPSVVGYYEERDRRWPTYAEDNAKYQELKSDMIAWREGNWAGAGGLETEYYELKNAGVSKTELRRFRSDQPVMMGYWAEKFKDDSPYTALKNFRVDNGLIQAWQFSDTWEAAHPEKGIWEREHPQMAQHQTWKDTWRNRAPELMEYLSEDPDRGRTERSQFFEQNLKDMQEWMDEFDENHPEILEFHEANPSLKEAWDYEREWKELHPEVAKLIEDANNAADEFLDANPDIPAYWEFKRLYEEKHPELTPYISNKPADEGEAAVGEGEATQSDFLSNNPALSRLFMAGISQGGFSDATMRALHGEWELSGSNLLFEQWLVERMGEKVH